MARKPKRSDSSPKRPSPAIDSGSGISAETENRKAYQRPFLLSLASAILFWMCLRPLGFWPLSFFALIPLVVLIMQPDAVRTRRDYLKIWMGGCIHWLILVYFVILPHWAGIFGWLLMGLYFGLYFPLFVLMGRSLMHGFRIPALIAIPMAWAACELIRSYMVTGLGVALLSHTFVDVPLLIQTSDLLGGIGTSWLVMTITVCLVEIVVRKMESKELAWGRLIIAFCVIGFMIGYGSFRLSQISHRTVDRDDPGYLKAALIQGSIDTEFPATVQEEAAFYDNQFEHYRALTVRARQEHPDLDLIVWPESIFPMPHFFIEGGPKTPDQDRRMDDRAEQFAYMHSVVQGADRLKDEAPAVIQFQNAIPMMTGAGAYDPETDKAFNSILLIDRFGRTTHRYDKNHLVMFGEYFPFGSYMPWVYKLMPISDGLQAGKEPSMIPVGEVKFAPSVCFESTVGHVIRRHINQLGREGKEPDYIANLSNDGWFFGTNCLDLHFTSNVFRSVELRKASIITANTGFSGHVDAAGRLLQKGPRRDAEILIVELAPQPDHFSLYRLVGDWPMIAISGLALFAVVADFWRRRKLRNAADKAK